MIEIKNRWTGAIILSLDVPNLRDADLSGADLSGADLSSANLSDANLSSADLRYTDLRDANLSSADLRYTDLRYTNLRYTNLSRADLRHANLSHATLSSANLHYTNLSSANLRYTNLSYTNLSDANLSSADLPIFQLVTKGTMKVYKKASGKVVELIIPSQAKRTSSLIGRKCRCEYAYVKRILGINGEPSGLTEVTGNHDCRTIYEIGKKVTPDKYDDDIRVECSHGIHFFITFEEAATY